MVSFWLQFTIQKGAPEEATHLGPDIAWLMCMVRMQCRGTPKWLNIAASMEISACLSRASAFPPISGPSNRPSDFRCPVINRIQILAPPRSQVAIHSGRLLAVSIRNLWAMDRGFWVCVDGIRLETTYGKVLRPERHGGREPLGPELEWERGECKTKISHGHRRTMCTCLCRPNMLCFANQRRQVLMMTRGEKAERP